MQSEKNKLRFYLGILLGLVGAFSLTYVLVFSIVHSSEWFESSANIISAACAVISTVFIVLTAIWAKDSFWYTEEKDKIERSLLYIQKLSDPVIFEIEQFIFTNFPVNSFTTKDMIELIGRDTNLTQQETFNKIHQKILPLLCILEHIGLLTKQQKINFSLLHDFFSLDFQILFPKIERYLDEDRKENANAWKNIFYLKDCFYNFKSFNVK